MTSLDLVGKLHRTVYVAGCGDDNREDLLRLMLQRCGPIEAWDTLADSGRLVVIFQSLNSVSNALSFNGLSFVDLTKKVIVWRATESPPVAVAGQQLALGDGGAASSAVESEEARCVLREAREQRRAAVQAALGADVAQFDYSNPQVRDAKLRELSYRQLKALATITSAFLTEKQRELVEVQRNAEISRSLLASLEVDHAAAPSGHQGSSTPA